MQNHYSGVTTMLNFFTTSNGFRSTLPVVSNLTAMNVWDGVCMCFIYASLLEFVCVNYMGRKRPQHNVVYRPGENPVTQVNGSLISISIEIYRNNLPSKILKAIFLVETTIPIEISMTYYCLSMIFTNLCVCICCCCHYILNYSTHLHSNSVCRLS